MEIKINIPKNDYVQPTEVREEVVQMICDSLTRYAKLSGGDGGSLWVPKSEPTLKLDSSFKKPHLTQYYWFRKGLREGDIRVRTCEMAAAVDAIQDAGYFVYKIDELRETIYHFSTKPCYNGIHATRVKFTSFID